MKDGETKNMGRDVFISYASDKGDSTGSRDREAADKIYTALKNRGIGCWAAHRDIFPGDNWLRAIIDAVEKSKILILVFSENANDSQWVKDEVTMALDEKIWIIPFRIDDVPPRGELKILKYRCQWPDAFKSSMEEHIGELVNVVCRHLGKEAKTSEKIKVNEQTQPPKEKMPGEVKSVESKAQRIYTNEKGFREADYGDGIKMVYIPEGEFTMGQTEEEKQWLIDQIGKKDYNKYYKNELPLHTVYLDGYWMGKYEITFAQYDKYCEATGKRKPDDRGWGRGDRPVISISWEDANAYCEWLSEKKGLNFKLPTEAQWEKAARGVDGRKYPWGNREPDETLANFEMRSGKTSPVGSYPTGASPYGLLDMAGNVWEWCDDWYGADYYKNSPKENPPGPANGSNRVVRGGGWSDDAGILRCASHSYGRPSSRDYGVGFRLCQDR